MKQLKKDNEDMHKKLQYLQEKNIKGVEAMEYRHEHFKEVDKAINEMMKAQPASPAQARIIKIWAEYVEYVKTRDKKIRAMEEHIRKKDKELAQKGKIE